MAQKMAPSKVASKKAANKKLTARKYSPSPVIAKTSAKTGPRPATKTAKAKPAVAAQAPKRTAKAAPSKSQSHKPAAAKSAQHPKAAQHKTVAKETAKAPHPAPKRESVSKPAAPKPTPSLAKAMPMPPPVAARPAAGVAPRTMPASVASSRASQRVMAPPTPQTVAAAAPAAVPAQPASAKPAAAAAPVAPQPQPTGASTAKKDGKPVQQKLGFKVNEWIVYPAHGVGRIVAIEEQEIAGISLELFVITFEKDKMTLRVPTGKSTSVGMRKLAEEATVKKAIETLKGRARVKRTMWSRRAQEYEAKINSGDLIAIAEVVRDLYRSESQPEQSDSERQLYEAALDRMAREIAVVEKLDERGAVQRITEVLAKSARGRNVAAEAA